MPETGLGVSRVARGHVANPSRAVDAAKVFAFCVVFGLLRGEKGHGMCDAVQGSLIRPENYHEELIDIKHYRNWDGPPKYDMYSDD